MTTEELKTVNNVFIELWTLRSSGAPYNKKEKRLWMLLQEFLESKGARQTQVKAASFAASDAHGISFPPFINFIRSFSCLAIGATHSMIALIFSTFGFLYHTKDYND